MAVVLTLILMSFYYIWRVAYITPWYDELYTYYYFISRGPLYAAIHWPLPNNHVGYSVLSAFFNMFGNSYIGLRGVSFLCAILNNLLVFRISRRFVDEWLAYGAMLLYFSCMLINDLSVQGRGYTLATTCFLICIREIIVIVSFEYDRIRDYVIFAISLILGLYTLPSSIYWVISCCVATAVFLIVNGNRSVNDAEKRWNNRYYRKLKKFLISGMVAAFITFILYAVIWLAIGSNLLVKDETGAYFGMGHVQVILRHPLASALRGIEYMLSQPYIQSVPRKGYLLKLFDWIKALAGYMYPVFWGITVLFVFFGIIILIFECIRHFENSRTIFSLLMIMNAAGFLLILILQAKLPYYRVFSYMGFVTAMSTVIVIEFVYQKIIMIFGDKIEKLAIYEVIHLLPALLTVMFSALMFLNPAYFSQHGERESNCYNALFIMNPENEDKLCVMDCDQQYLLKFGWNIDCDNTDPTGCKFLLLDRHMTEENYSGSDFWKFYQTYETLPWDYINSEMYVFYENEDFILYKR